MRKFIILNQIDMQLLCENKPVTFRIDDVPFVLCTDEYYEKEMKNEAEKPKWCPLIELKGEKNG